MEDQNNIIDEHLLEKKLIGVWELVEDSSRKIVEGYALSLEGYFLEIETMLDVSAISIGCGHIKSLGDSERMAMEVFVFEYVRQNPHTNSHTGCDEQKKEG